MAATGHTHRPIGNQNLIADRTDPTGTVTLRERQFVPDMRGRFRRIRGLIRQTVGYQNDAFGLVGNVDPVEFFEGRTTPAKEAEFQAWLAQAFEDEVLEPVGTFEVRAGRHWTGRYIRRAYSKGTRDAERFLRAQGVGIGSVPMDVTFNRPITEASLKRIYTAKYRDLADIATEAPIALREELARGLAAGENPRTIARRINKRVETIQNTRALAVARTAVIDAHATATLDRYDRLGVGTVTIRAEWRTAGDERVCPICASLDGETMSTTEARTGTFHFDASGEDIADSLAGTYRIRPPTHVGCRCVLLPVVT